jgi:hypothetical protein
MTLLVCWVAFPLLLGVLAQGCGTLVERAAGNPLALGVRIPCGVALMIAVLDLATRATATAHLAVAAVVAVSALGLAVAPPWRWRWQRAHAGALAAAGIVFAVYAAPVVLSGMATWTGYIKLDDTATWLALVDRALSAGRTLAGLPPSTYRDVLSNYLTVGYPLGSFLPMGIGHALLGEDVAWLVNPWMAFLAAVLALALHRIAALCLGGERDLAERGPGERGRDGLSRDEHGPGERHPDWRRDRGKDRARGWQPVAIAALAAQPALLYGYYLWGGIKELAGAMLIAAFAVAAPAALTGERRVRALLPAAVVLWALIAAQSPGGLVWAGPGAVLALALWALVATLGRRATAARAQPTGEPARPSRTARTPAGRRPRASFPLPVLGLMLVVAAGGAYLVLRPGGFVQRFRAVLTGGKELGNLVKPLSAEQIVGIWPTGDFRFAPAALGVTHVLIVVAALCAAAGFALAVRDGRRELVLYVLCALAGAVLVDTLAAPWLGAKALASASPAVPLAALTAVAVVWARRGAWIGRIAGRPERAARRAAAASSHRRPGPAFSGPRLAGAAIVLAAGAIAVGVVWSNVLAYHDVNLAPRIQFAELAQIGERTAGQGPTLMTEYQPYGARHFLREAAPEAASELREREDPLISGELLEKGESADVDQLQLPAILAYRTLVLQRSPVGSRPPSPYRLTFADRFWEVWQRPARLRRAVVWHLPLGDATHPGAVPGCATVTRLARRRGVAELLAEPVENPLVVGLTRSSHPAAWAAQGAALAPSGAGTARLTVAVRRAGRYTVWLGGSTRGPLSIYLDDYRVGTASQEIQESGQYIPFGALTLRPGSYTVVLRYGGEQWRPGTGGPPEAVGPLVLRREGPADGGSVARRQPTAGRATARQPSSGQAIAREPLVAVAPGDAHSLCGRTLDWVEGVGA